MRRSVVQSALVLASVLMIAALAGCGGGSKTAATLSSMPVTGLPDNSPREPGTTTIPAGASRPIGEADGVRTVATCPAGGEACVVSVAEDGKVAFTGGEPTVATYTLITGLPEPEGRTLASATLSPGESTVVQETGGMRTLLTCPADGPPCEVVVRSDGAAEYTGGAPTVATYTPIDLPVGSLEPGRTTVLAGGSRVLLAEGNAETLLTCPADGPACVLIVAEDGAAEYTGGTPAVVMSFTGLPDGHDLTAGTTIPAGESRTLEGAGTRGVRTDLACPEGGEDCLFTFVSGSFAEFEGGTPTLTSTRNEMVWQANNGPDGDSDGAHARGLQGRFRSSTSTDLLFRTGPGAQPQILSGTIVKNTRSSTTETRRTVTATAAWSTGTAPTLGLSVSGLGSDTFSVVEGSNVPSLGTGWNSAVLRKTGNTGRTALAVVHSNIEDGTGGTVDSNYMTFGTWLEIPDSSTASSSSYNLGVFADPTAGNQVTRANIGSLSGTATYRGPAAGFYSKGDYTGTVTPVVQSAVVGSFTATAALTLSLTGSGTVSGNITDFRENGESLGDWRVNLNGTNQGGTDNIFQGSTGGSADGQTWSGRYGAAFYRPGSSGNPTSAMVVFAAGSFSNNTARFVAGAFGAELQP